MDLLTARQTALAAIWGSATASDGELAVYALCAEVERLTAELVSLACYPFTLGSADAAR